MARSVILFAALCAGGCNTSGDKVVFRVSESDFDLGGNTAREGEGRAFALEYHKQLGPTPVVLVKQPRNLFDGIDRPSRPLFPVESSIPPLAAPGDPGQPNGEDFDPKWFLLLLGAGEAYRGTRALARKVKHGNGDEGGCG